MIWPESLMFETGQTYIFTKPPTLSILLLLKLSFSDNLQRCPDIRQHFHKYSA